MDGEFFPPNSNPNQKNIIKENKTASELQKNTINLENQEKEINRANSAVEETQIRIQQIKNDMDREQFLFNDAKLSPLQLQYYLANKLKYPLNLRDFFQLT